MHSSFYLDMTTPDMLPAFSLINVLSYPDVGRVDDPCIVPTGTLKRLIFERAYQLSMSDLPIELQCVCNHMQNTAQFTRLSNDHKTLYMKKTFALPPSATQETSEKYAIVIYTYDLGVELTTAIDVRHWLDAKLNMRGHHYPDTPFYYVLCKGLRHFAKHNNMRAVTLIRSCISKYFEILIQNVEFDILVYNRRALYEQFRRVFFAHINPHDGLELDVLFVTPLKQKYNIHLHAMDFDQRLRLVFVYKVVSANNDSLSELKSTVTLAGGTYLNPSKDPLEHLVFGPPHESSILGDTQLADDLERPLCKPVDLQKRLSTMLSSAQIATILDVLYRGVSQLYQLTGAWINVQPIIDTSDVVTAWSHTRTILTAILNTQRIRPYTPVVALQFVLEYIALRRFLQYYIESEMPQTRTINQVQVLIDRIVLYFQKKADMKNLTVEQRDIIYRDHVQPWIEKLVHHYETHDRDSPFVKLLERYQYRWRKINTIAAATPELEKYQHSQNAKQYDESYWRLMVTMWTRLQTLHLQAKQHEMSNTELTQSHKWLQQKLREIHTFPESMAKHIRLDFAKFQSLSYLRNYLPPSIAKPYLTEYQYELQHPQPLVATTPLQDHFQRVLRARAQYLNLESAILIQIINYAIVEPAPMFLSK